MLNRTVATRAARLALIMVCYSVGGGCGGGGSGGGQASLSLTGAWTSFDFFGHETIFYMHERADGRVIGYMPADPSLRLTGGTRSGDVVDLEFSQDDPGLSVSGTFTGTLVPGGNTMNGTYNDGGGALPTAFARWNTPLTIEHWLLVDFALDKVLGGTRLHGAADAFVTGGFVGLDDCSFLGCAGDWTSWSVVGDDHTIASATGGVIPATANLMGTWSMTEMLVMGTYTTSTDPTVRDFAAGRSGFGESAAVGNLLRTLAGMLDAFESESPTVGDALTATYLHDGRSKADVMTDVNALYTAYDNLEATATVSQIVSGNTGEEFPDLTAPPRVEWELEVTGEPTGGGARETILALDTREPDQEDLRWVTITASDAKFSGSGYATPFEIEMPIHLADSAAVAFRLWPYGVHGGGHPEGHGGWDVEFACGTQVRAAADGTVSDVRPNDGWPGQWSVTITHRPGRSTRYGHLENLQPGIVVGAPVTVDQVIADAGQTGPHCITHFAMRTGVDATCPLPFLSTTGRAVFDSIWSAAAYNEEFCEPFACNPIDVSFPLTRQWARESGGLAPRIDITRLDPTTSAYDYTLRTAGGAVLETGSITFNPIALPHATIDLTPAGGGATHLGVYDIVDDTMWIDWNNAVRPVSLVGASVYRTSP